jgi:phosphoribosylanthranilate isomerase
VFVKICGITSEEDALLAVAMGADAVGFNFVPSSPRFLAVTRAADIAKRLPPEILTVGIFRDSAPSRVVELVQQAGLRAAQLHGHETAAETKWVRERLPLVINWSLAEGAPSGLRILLAGGLTADNVAEAIARVRPWGVDVASGTEASPGVKDPTLVRRFIQAAQAAEPEDYHGREDQRPFDWMLDE